MNRSEWLALLLAAAAIITQSFVPPVVGLANNGDFAKIAGQFDVGNPSDARDVGRFADTRYVVDPQYHYESRFYSSELLLFAAALGLNSVFGHPEVVDLRLLGVVHALVLLLAFYLFLPLVRGFRLAFRFALVFLVLVVFMDVMYVSYLNSLYMDTAALLFLLLSVVSFLRALLWRRPADRWLFVASAVLLITSKTQHYPLGIPIALMLAWKGGVLIAGPNRLFRSLSVICVLTATAFSCLRGAPRNYPAAGAYTVIFFELLPKSGNMASDLKDLGLDDSYRRYIGTNAYSSDAGLRAPQFEDAFVRQSFYSRLARFFLMHPSTAWNVMVSRMDGAGLQRPYVGNFDRAAGFPEYTRSWTFAFWSDWKILVFGRHGGRYLLYSLSLALTVTAFAIVRRKSLLSGIPAAVVALVAIMLTELAVASFADALDPERQYSLFGALTDLLLISGICLVAQSVRQAAVATMGLSRRGGRVVDCGGLENR